MVQMEALYSKLYEKYTKLKTRRESEIDQLNHDQEVKFMNYVSAAEELIEHLRSENDRLQGQINDLKDEVASTRSAKEGQYAECQKLLIEEIQKTKELSEEINRLQNLQQRGLSCSTKGGTSDNGLLDFSVSAQVGSRSLSKGSSRKKSRRMHTASQTDEARVISYPIGQVNHSVVEPKRDSSRGLLLSDVDRNIQQANCCMRKTISSEDRIKANCLFQTLMECLVGMKFASVDETEGLCLSVLHQSSGYSFSLTWIDKGADEQAELLYHASSLGTFERVAPGWMKEDLMFSTSMCPIFFKRVSQVIGLCC